MPYILATEEFFGPPVLARYSLSVTHQSLCIPKEPVKVDIRLPPA
jgi:hypothetical protein